ncbi:hypothetical protein BREVNS_0957 [Brevinematales bacterium NS]|nr:hypothetical protein BREVNS_0957 [Brevinematales bacterium NS]
MSIKTKPFGEKSPFFFSFFLKKCYNMSMKKWIWVLFLLWNVMAALDVLPLSEIRPGMKGTGYSVFSGWDPVPFEVEVIDVMQGTTVEETLILARLSGQKLEQSGVVAGMSGSPVYIEGKLIGAVAYAWSFSKEALCGITPIQAMIGRTSENTSPSSKPSQPGKNETPSFLPHSTSGQRVGKR